MLFGTVFLRYVPGLPIIEIEFVLDPLISFLLYKFASFLEFPLIGITLLSLGLIEVY